MVWSTRFDGDPRLLAHVSGDGFPANRLFFAEVKDLPLDGTVETDVEDLGGGEALVRVTAHGYAYLVHIPSPAPGVRFRTNHVDLRDGETVEIHVSGIPASVDVADLRGRTYAGPSVLVAAR